MPTQSSTPKRGKHIQYTGIDGAGKSTQAGKLTYYLLKKYGPTYLAESRTDFISKLMHTLAWQHGRTDRRTYYGDHVVDFAKAFDVIRNHNTEIEPLLAAGMHVVEPRSIYCRTAMALAMTGKRDEKTEQLLELIPKPNLLVWIDTDPRVALERVQKRGIDVEKLEDLEKFSSALRAMPPSQKWVRIDGNMSRQKIFLETRKHADILFS
jgi:dTMP kinase